MATERRSISADRAGRQAGREAGSQAGGHFDRLAEALEKLTTASQQTELTRERFPTPQFEGTGDVDYYIRQFSDVTQANKWQPDVAILHLRAALKGAAIDCGKATTLSGVFENLRARFGLTPREAKARLAGLKRDSRTSLHEHAELVRRLVNIAYADLPSVHAHKMALDTFQTTLGDTSLQRHLLAIDTPDLETAVRAGNEYLQIQPARGTGTNIRQVEESTSMPEGTVAVTNSTDPCLEALLKAVQKLSGEIDALKKTNKRPVQRCFGCKLEGHIRRDCITHPWPLRQKSGNGQGPQ